MNTRIRWEAYSCLQSLCAHMLRRWHVITTFAELWTMLHP